MTARIPVTLTILFIRDGDTLNGHASAGDDIAFDLRNWRKVSEGIYRCEVERDAAFEAYLARLEGRITA